uniref:Calreticulin n=1 Tax=Myxobolus bejeranoi TaxID=2015852 RepID=A0AA50Q9B0_9CNID|nr:calreticulin [Myxobolus bejeranoi]
MLALLLFYMVHSKIYLDEKFEEGFEKRWVISEDTSVTHGTLKVVEKEHCDKEYGLKFLNDSSFYHASLKLKEDIDFTKSDFYFHYVAQYQKDHDCGGVYVKFFNKLDQKNLNRDTPYSVMFGPDMCGYSTKTIHLIISHNDKNHQLKDKINFDNDGYPHLISVFIGKDRKFWVKLDGEVKKEGILGENFDYLLPKTIDDPEDKKPEDWEDNPMIDDPEDKKPEDWDDRKEIPDTNATKPENWNDEDDGEWEPDLIKNPDYKGEWAPKRIANPKYKGEWKAKQLPNPDFVDDKTFGDHVVSHIGIDIWTVKSGQMLDNMFVSDDAQEFEKDEKRVLEEIKQVTDKMKEIEKQNAPKEAPADEPEESSEEKEDSEEKVQEEPKEDL